MKTFWRAGAWIGLWQVSWPFATLDIGPHLVELKAWPYDVRLFALTVEEVSGIRIIPFLLTGVCIGHRNPALPRRIIFWAPVWDTEGLLNVFKSFGYATA